MSMDKQVARSALSLLLLVPTFAQQSDHPNDPREQQMPMPDQKPRGQQTDTSQMSGHEGMQMPGMSQGMQMNQAGMHLMNMASGTSMNPQSWPMPMLMPRLGSWNLMFMGQAFIVDTQQSGPRDGDKLYSPSAFM